MLIFAVKYTGCLRIFLAQAGDSLDVTPLLNNFLYGDSMLLKADNFVFEVSALLGLVGILLSGVAVAVSSANDTDLYEQPYAMFRTESLKEHEGPASAVVVSELFIVSSTIGCVSFTVVTRVVVSMHS